MQKIEHKIGVGKAVVIVPEIYGINQYIKDWADFFKQQGYEPFCVDLCDRDHVYRYSESNEAYCDFISKVGFGRYKEIAVDLEVLKDHYKKIIVFGSSVGATIAWRLTENRCCDGMIGYYGSRIRDYLDVSPVCPCLLIFAEQEESFVVQSIIPMLDQMEKVETFVLPGKHGFADRYGKDFYEQSGNKGLDMVKYFLRKIEHG
ncbi:MAG: dienelactone hydrolase family protein [Acetobacterium sp.]|nr:dienelactone hydrolase family protein [Acetobacterium sp.]